MQLVRDIYATKGAAGKPVISFEFFPPKTDEGDRNLLEKTLPALLETRPDYCSVTYGAGGSTREKTLMIVDRIQKQHGLTAVAHLTCVNATRDQIRDTCGTTVIVRAAQDSSLCEATRLLYGSVRISEGDGVKATLHGWMCEGWITCLPESPIAASSHACL